MVGVACHLKAIPHVSRQSPTSKGRMVRITAARRRYCRAPTPAILGTHLNPSHRLLAALLTALFVLAACGTDARDESGDTAAGSPPTAEPETVPEAEPEPEVAPEPGADPDPGPSPRIVPMPRPGELVSGPITPDLFSDPAEVAEQLAAAEAAIRSPDTSDDLLRAWAWTQQQAYRDLVANPGWHDEVRAALPESLVGVFDRNVEAGAKLRELTSPRDALPNWRIVEPPPADELLRHYRASEAEFGVAWKYLAAIHLVETRMGRIQGVSVAGARGPMQFMPATWDAYGEGDIDDPSDAIRAAARYLTASGAPDDMRRALFAYNRSDHYVDAIIAHAQVMADDERAYLAYHHWQVYYRLETGDVVLPVGWERG